MKQSSIRTATSSDSKTAAITSTRRTEATTKVADRHIKTTNLKGSRTVNQSMQFVIFDTDKEADPVTGLPPVKLVAWQAQKAVERQDEKHVDEDCISFGATVGDTTTLTAAASAKSHATAETEVQKQTVSTTSQQITRPILIFLSSVLLLLAVSLLTIKLKNRR